jgi:DNA polymerase-1
MQELGGELRQKVAEANKQMLPGKTVTSPKDLADHLFTRMGYPVISTTKKGTRQVDEAVLVALRDEHNCDLAGDVLKVRELEKLTTTYLTPYPKLVEPDGRIHCFFNTTRTVTGRLSSDSPNLQNVPRDKRIRTLFVSSPGWGFLYGDLSNAEMRIAACLSRDPALVEAFQNDVDVHNLTASSVLEIPIEAVTKDQRQKAKPVNFGFLYGQQAKGFISYAKTHYNAVFSMEEAERARSKYFLQYRGLTPWYKEVTDEMYQHEMIYTEFGRGRRFPGVRSMDRGAQMRCERQAINTKVQSLGGELTTMIVTATQGYVQREGMQSRVVLTVHDSVMTDGPWDELPKIARFIYEYVKGLSYPWLRVPMKIDLEMGDKMGDTKGIKEGVDF